MLQAEKKKMVVFSLMLLLFASIAIFFSQKATAQETFSVGLTVCNPSWFCTAYTQVTCGTRTCIDTNGCGINDGKPLEYLVCPEEPPSGGSSGGTAGSIVPKPNLSGSFIINYDVVKVTIPQNAVAQKLIKITGSSPDNYTFEIEYPLNYSGKKDFISTSNKYKFIEKSGDFNLIIDANNMSIGTYIVRLNILNSKYSKEFTAVVEVVPKNNIQIDIDFDSNVKNLGVENEIEVYSYIRGISLLGNETLEYRILDPKGNELYYEVFSENIYFNMTKKIYFPDTVEEGYYTLSLKLLRGDEEYVKSATFTVIPLDKYFPELESPVYLKKNELLKLIIGIAIAVLIVSFVFVSYVRGVERNRKLRGKKNMSPEHKLKILENVYKKGFISSEEYKKMVKDSGFISESQRIEKEIKEKESQNQEKIEAKEELKEESHKDKKEVIVDEHVEQKKKEHAEKESKKEDLPNESKNKYDLDKKTSDSESFVLNDGKKLFCLRDLLNALDEMPDYVFNHHVLQGRNDFSSWTEGALKYSDLAEEINSAKSKKALAEILQKYK